MKKIKIENKYDTNLINGIPTPSWPGVISYVDKHAGSNYDYRKLFNKPSINKVELNWDKTQHDLQLDTLPAGDVIPSGEYVGQLFILMQSIIQGGKIVTKGIYRYNGSLWNKVASFSAETTLWKNPSPTASFSAQTVKLSDSLLNYDKILIQYLNIEGSLSSVYTNMPEDVEILPIGITLNETHVNVDTQTLKIYERHAIIRNHTGSEITFNDTNVVSNNTFSVDNTLGIPYKIVGIN